LSIDGKLLPKELPIELGYNSIHKLAYGRSGFISFLNTIF